MCARARVCVCVGVRGHVRERVVCSDEPAKLAREIFDLARREIVHLAGEVRELDLSTSVNRRA